MKRFVRRRSLAVISLTFVFALFANPMPAHADVDTVIGGGFAAFADVLGLVLVPHSPAGEGGTATAPGVNFTASEPDDGFDENVPGLAVDLGALAVNALNVSTEAEGVASLNHNAFVTTTSSVANVRIGAEAAPGLTADLIGSTCTSSGDGSTASTQIVGLDIPGTTEDDNLPEVITGDAVTITVPGIANIIINESVEVEQQGFTSVTVNALHVTLLGTGVEVILGQSRCTAIGPDVNVPTGSLTVTKVAPQDAQGVTFTFTITCPGVPGSPFTRTVTGSGTTQPVEDLVPGVVCTVREEPVEGFVAQPDQTAPTITSSNTPTVTFVNTRTAAGTGSVAVAKQAPDDADDVTFTFTITCPGVAGSPFTRTVTGTGTTTAVSNIPAGTVCTVSESPVSGFVDQPSQTFPAVVANTTQTVTFFNQRVGENVGQVAVVKQAPSDAQNVTFTFNITCPGVAGSPFTRTVTGSGTTTAVGNIPAGTVCTVSESAVSGFEDQPSQTFQPVVAGQTRTVTFVNTRTDDDDEPAIDIEKSASPTSLPQPGGVVTFTVRVRNTGDETLEVTSLNDDVHGNLDGRGNCDVPFSLAAGQSFTCSFSVEFFGFAGASETDRVTVTARDPDGDTVTDVSNSVTVTIVQSGVPIFPPQQPILLLFPVDDDDDRGPIIVNNNNSSSSSSSAAASAGGAGAAPVAQAGPVQAQAPAVTQTSAQTTRPQGQLLARTGANSMSLFALGLAMVIAGRILRGGKPAYATEGQGPSVRTRKTKRSRRRITRR